MEFVFEHPAEGTSIQNLTVVKNPTHTVVAIVLKRALGENHCCES
jgi:hypothetical protein